MTINKFIETLCIDNAEQLVTIYDRSNNIIYHGKADFAPLNLFDEVKTTETKQVNTIDGTTVTVININERTSDTQLDKEKRMRYNVTTRSNCFLRGFVDFQTAIDFCCSLDICVKLFDNATGVTVDLGVKKR